MGLQMTEINITYETLYEIMRTERTREELQELSPAFYQDVVVYLSRIKRLYEDASSSGDDEGRDDHQRQLRNVKNLIKEIYDRRETKIIHLALMVSRTSTATSEVDMLLPHERELYDQCLRVINHYRSHVLKATLDGTTPTTVQQFTAPAAKPLPKTPSDDASVHHSVTPPQREPKETVHIKKQSEEEKAAQSDEAQTLSAPSTKKQVMFLQEVPKFLGKELEVYGPYAPSDTAQLPSYLADILIAKGKAKEA